MNKHTPGPWNTTLRAAPVEDGNDDELEIAISGSNPDQRTIAATFKTDGFTVDGYEMEGCSLEEAQANARLIAAAPDLLEALKQFLAWGEGKDCEYPFQQARAAISKALGGAA